MSTKRGRHKSAGPALNRRLLRLAAQDIVSKIILGATSNCRHSYAPGHLKLQMITDAGMKINGYDGNGVIQIHVYCEEKDKEAVRALLDS